MPSLPSRADDPHLARRHERRLFLAFTAFLEVMVWVLFYEPTTFEPEGRVEFGLFFLAQVAIAFNLACGWNALKPDPKQSKLDRNPKPRD